MQTSWISAVVLGLGIGLVPSQSFAAESDPWQELFSDVEQATQRLLESPGMRMESDYGTLDVDLTTGYAREGDGDLVDWMGSTYSRNESAGPRAWRLLGIDPRAWEFWGTGGENNWVRMGIPTMNIAAGYPRSTWTPTKSVSADHIVYSLRSSTGATSTVEILPNGVRLIEEDMEMAWLTSAVQVNAPEQAVWWADLADARDTFRATRQVTRLVHKIRQRHLDQQGTLQHLSRMSEVTRAFTYRATPRGIMLWAHNRYLHKRWRLSWVGSRLTVRGQDLHPPGWRPRVTVVQVPPETPVTDLGRQAVARLGASFGFVHAQQTFRVGVTQASLGSFVFALRMADGAVAVLGGRGQPAAVSGVRGKQCVRLPETPSARLETALAMTGRPDATWSCGPTQDDFLAWLPMYGPFGLFLPWATLLFDPAMTSTNTGAQHTYELKTSLGHTLVTFDGQALTHLRFDEFGEDSPGVLDLTYSYEPLTFDLPPASERVRGYLLDQARLSLQAPALVRKASVRARECMRRADGRGRSPATARTRCFEKLQYSLGRVELDQVPGGIRASLVTKFSVDRRSAVWSDARGTFVLRDKVHRRG